MTGPEVTAAMQRAADAGGAHWPRVNLSDDHRAPTCAGCDFTVPESGNVAAWHRAFTLHGQQMALAAALDVPQMAAAIVGHENTDTLPGDSETLVCGGCDHVLVTGNPDDDRDPQAEHATHHAALIRAALIGADS